MRIFILSAMLFVGSFAVAGSFKVGDTIIFSDYRISMKALVAEMVDGKIQRIEFFGDPSVNAYFGNQPDANSIMPYRHVDKLDVKNYFANILFKLKIGDQVLYKDSATEMKGRVTDLTADGFALVDFGPEHEFYNLQYVAACDSLTPIEDKYWYVRWLQKYIDDQFSFEDRP